MGVYTPLRFLRGPMLKSSLSILFLVGILMGHVAQRSLVVILVRTSDGRQGVRATVKLGGHAQSTDKSGKVTFSNYPSGTYELLVTPEPPYKSFRWTVTVPTEAPVVFKLERPE